VKQHLGRQSGVQSVDVSLLDGKVEIIPKDDGRIDPAGLLRAAFDSGVTVGEMNITARGKIVRDSSEHLVLQATPDQSFVLTPNDLSKGLESLAGASSIVTVRGQLYKKPPGKKKGDSPGKMQLTVLEVQKRE